MPRRNPKSPWNPARAADISSADYERQVVEWLKATGADLASFNVQHLRRLEGGGGEYEFDAVAEFTLLQGARLVLLVECKRYSSPVEREKLLALWAKLQDVKAHKAMMFATCGFQSGALEYAQKYGIATVTFVNGSFLYETRGVADDDIKPPPWANLPKYAGIVVTRTETGHIRCRTIDGKRADALAEWLIN